MKQVNFTQYELLLLLGVAIMVIFLLIIVTFSWIHQKKKGREEKRQFDIQSDYQAKLHEIRIQHEEKERFRFSSDLQKEVKELKSSINEIQALVHQAEDAALRKKLSELSEKLSMTEKKIETVSRKIAPSMLPESGLVHALESLVTQLNALGKADLYLMEKSYTRQDELAEIMLFRIAEEIISNALKHGNPNRIDLFLTGNEVQVALEVRDNGLPFDLQKKLSENNIASPGNGLKNIASRLQHHTELSYTYRDGTNRNKIVANYGMN